MKLVLNVFVALLVSVSLFGQDTRKSEQKITEELTIGKKAPDFTLEDPSGKKYTLSSFKGKEPVVVYFYPQANTGGCTKQACGIRDDWSKFEKNNIMVLGISTDPKDEIQKFIDNNKLNFPLLSDLDKKVSAVYGVLNEGGKDKRVTFIVDKKGNIAKIINVDDIPNHSKTVYEIASKLN